MDEVAEQEKSPKICVITGPYSQVMPGYALLLNYIEIFKPLANTIHVITGNIPVNEISTKGLHLHNIKINLDRKSIQKSMLVRAFMRIITQIKICSNLFRISKDVDVVIFYSIPYYLLPILLAKILKKKVMWIVAAQSSKIASHNFGYRSIAGYILRRLEKIAFFLSDCIVPQSESIVYQRKLYKYKNKIAPSGARFIDTTRFKVMKDINQRKNVIGYIGRFRGEKGVTNFVQAIPRILKKNNQVKFLIGGDGQLFNEIERKVRSYPHDRITLTKWIPHENLPDYLNELKLFVLPSYTEGLPTTMLEAMACGTPVLATSVGGVPDVIKDGETGFILEDNSPECIAENVIRVLKYPDLDKIVKNARKLIAKEFSYEAAVGRYRKIFNNVRS